MRSIIKIICWLVMAIGLIISIVFYSNDNLEVAIIGAYIMAFGCLVLYIVTVIRLKGK